MVPPDPVAPGCPQQSEEDVSHFDTRFTRQTPVDSPDDTALSESANQAFLVRPGGLGAPGQAGRRAGGGGGWAVMDTEPAVPAVPRASPTWHLLSWTASRKASPSSPSCVHPGAYTAVHEPPSGNPEERPLSLHDGRVWTPQLCPPWLRGVLRILTLPWFPPQSSQVLPLRGLSAQPWPPRTRGAASAPAPAATSTLLQHCPPPHPPPLRDQEV